MHFMFRCYKDIAALRLTFTVKIFIGLQKAFSVDRAPCETRTASKS